jgi:GT2 family glycosyltransferase
VKVGVVVLNWHAAEDTKRCLLQVKSWSKVPMSCSATLWVVDNASWDDEMESLRRGHPDVSFLKSAVNRGFAGGCNMGIRAASESGCEAILLLNNDATLDRNSFDSMSATLASNQNIGVVGAVVTDGERILSAGGRDIAMHVVTHIRPRHPPQGLLDVDYVPGTAALIRREAFDAVGLYDEDYFFSGEMADFCLRTRRCGLRCVVDPNARTSHDLKRSAALRDTLHVYYSIRNRFLYVKKHYTDRRAALFLRCAARGGYAAAVALARGQRRRARAITLGVIDGLQGRFGGRNERILS